MPLHSAARVPGGAQAEGEDTGEPRGVARVQGGPSKALLDRRGPGIMAVKESGPCKWHSSCLLVTHGC